MTSLRNFALLSTCLAALACGGAGGDAASKPTPDGLLRPDAAAMARPAPDSFDVAFETGKGRFVVRAYRAWSPRGVDRFHYLVTNQYFDGVKFFRNIDGFMVQFGIHGEPAVNRVWENRNIPDDSVKTSNVPGTVSFATSGPSSRTVQLFINKGNNARLDQSGFAPFAKVTEGMDVVMKLFSGYGEGAPRGGGPDQARIQAEGNRYLNQYFPQLDSVVTARVTP